MKSKRQTDGRQRAMRGHSALTKGCDPNPLYMRLGMSYLFGTPVFNLCRLPQGAGVEGDWAPNPFKTRFVTAG